MKSLIALQFCLLVLSVRAAAQHGHDVAGKASAEPLSFAKVRAELLTDPALKGYKMESTVMTMIPGAEDTVSHRHDGDLFGYILEGDVQIGLEHKTPVTYHTGEMFFEKRNILHSVARNNSKEHPAKVLLIFIIKSGRHDYIPAYPEKTKDNPGNK